MALDYDSNDGRIYDKVILTVEVNARTNKKDASILFTKIKQLVMKGLRLFPGEIVKIKLIGEDPFGMQTQIDLKEINGTKK
jgi:hypothetical protein